MPESYSFLIKVNKKEKLVHTLNRVEKDVTIQRKGRICYTCFR